MGPSGVDEVIAEWEFPWKEVRCEPGRWKLQCVNYGVMLRYWVCRLQRCRAASLFLNVSWPEIVRLFGS
jgi:hypothetical protein